MMKYTRDYGVIRVTQRESDYIAYLIGDLNLWAAGQTAQEAIGNLWLTWHEELRQAIILARDFNDSGQTPGELLRNHRRSQQKAESEVAG